MLLKKLAAATCERAALHLAQRSLAGTSPPLRSFNKVIVVSTLAAKNGIASGAKLQFDNLIEAGVDARLVDVSRSFRNVLSRTPHEAATLYIFHIGGPQSGDMFLHLLPHVRHAYRIAYWAWEFPDPPASWRPFTALFSEIWTPSSFARDSLARLSAVPVRVAPHVVKAQSTSRIRRVGGPIRVLAIADSRSSPSRKNPLGAVQAFITAFGRSDRAELVIKISGKKQTLQTGDREFALIEKAVEGYPNIKIMTEDLDPAALHQLFINTEILISMHRSEGFGLPMLEAMAFGIPVVSTDWSGNTDFMDAHNSVLVPASIIPVRDKSGIYRGSYWAEPDMEAAVAALRHLATDREFYDAISSGAFASVSKSRFVIPDADGSIDGKA